VELLHKLGADVDKADNDGRTPTWMARRLCEIVGASRS
jgi:hypothetical protein